jgi:hypothetical protein
MSGGMSDRDVENRLVKDGCERSRAHTIVEQLASARDSKREKARSNMVRAGWLFVAGSLATGFTTGMVGAGLLGIHYLFIALGIITLGMLGFGFGVGQYSRALRV